MKTFQTIVHLAAFGFLCHGAFAQQAGDPKFRTPFPADIPQTGEQWRFNLVKHLMSLPSPVKNGAVQLHGMGDEAAVDVLKILGTSPNLTAAQIESVLDIVHTAFEQQASIIDPVNTKPQAAAVLFQRLTSLTEDAAVKERIGEELKFVQSLPALPIHSVPQVRRTTQQ